MIRDSAYDSRVPTGYYSSLINAKTFCARLPNTGIGFSSALLAALKPDSHRARKSATTKNFKFETVKMPLWSTIGAGTNERPNHTSKKQRYKNKVCLKWKALRVFLFGL